MQPCRMLGVKTEGIYLKKKRVKCIKTIEQITKTRLTEVSEIETWPRRQLLPQELWVQGSDKAHIKIGIKNKNK